MDRGSSSGDTAGATENRCSSNRLGRLYGRDRDAVSLIWGKRGFCGVTLTFNTAPHFKEMVFIDKSELGINSMVGQRF